MNSAEKSQDAHKEALLKPSPDPLILFGNRDRELHTDGTERNGAP